MTLMACPYEGEVELNTYEESIKIDKRMIDHWICYREEGARDELLIEKGARSVFFVSHKQYAKGNKLEKKDKYRAYATEIGGYYLFNVETTEGKYLFAKYGWTGKNEFYIQFINDDFMKKNFESDTTATTRGLRTFVSNNIENSSMFEEKLEFYRMYSPEYEKVRNYMRKSGF